MVRALHLLQLTMFRLICVTMNIQNVECRHGYVCATSHAMVYRQWRFVILQSTHQSDAASNHSHPALFVVYYARRQPYT